MQLQQTISKNAVAYLRVSTEEQTSENQKIFLERWAALHGYQITQFYIDKAVSGKLAALERKGFFLLHEYVRNNKVDAVLVYELSRIGRTFFETLEAIKEIDKYAPLVTCSPKEEFLQTTEPSVRKLLISIFSWVAEREREILIERTKAGLERAKSQGKVIGRPKKEIDLTYLKQLLELGCPKWKIARDLKMSKVTMYKVIKEHCLSC